MFRLARVLPWVTAFWVFVQLLSLRLPLLQAFFFDTAHADVQGIDYYSLPKAWLNLRASHSLYATFDPPAFGPHFTWYLSHPLLAIVLGWPLSHLAPADSYGAFTLLSLALLAVAAWAFGREAIAEVGVRALFHKRLLWLLFLGSFPGFLMLWVGNVQAPLVLGLSLLLAGFLRLQRGAAHAEACVLAGLLLSLFTKPVVLLMLPLLLLLRETRRATLWALAVYPPVSLLFLVLPSLNPEAVGLSRTVWLLGHPGFVQATMDIYENHLRLTPDMRDNSVHWFNLLAQSGFRLQHVDVYSLPVFLDGVLGVHTPAWLYALPTASVLALSVAVSRIVDARARLEAASLLLLAASLSFFLTYPTVWEYQYTAVLPVAAMLLVWQPASISQRGRRLLLSLACCAWGPSLYFLSGSAAPESGTLLLVRLDRVLPVTSLFLGLCFCAARATWANRATLQTGRRPW